MTIKHAPKKEKDDAYKVAPLSADVTDIGTGHRKLEALSLVVYRDPVYICSSGLRYRDTPHALDL